LHLKAVAKLDKIKRFLFSSIERRGKVCLLFAAFLFAGCSGIFSDSRVIYQMPDVTIVGSVVIYDSSWVAIGYDLNKSGRVDLLVVYPLKDGMIVPHIIQALWGEENKESGFIWYARQVDPDGDGEANWVSGDLKRLRRELRKFKQ